MTDPIVDAVCAKLQARSKLGVDKYGTTLSDNKAAVDAKLRHIQEELMDGANYIEWLLHKVEDAALLTETHKNVTCEKSSNADERKSADDKRKKALRVWEEFCDMFGHSFIYYDAHGNEFLEPQTEGLSITSFLIIREALLSPQVPVIDGLDEAFIGYEFGCCPEKFDLVCRAARAYAKLQKGV